MILPMLTPPIVSGALLTFIVHGIVYGAASVLIARHDPAGYVCGPAVPEMAFLFGGLVVLAVVSVILLILLSTVEGCAAPIAPNRREAVENGIEEQIRR